MKQLTFETKYRSNWEEITRIMIYLEKGKRARKKIIPAPDTDHFPAQYQILCQQLSIAEERHYSPQLIRYLQNLVQRGHQILYQRHNHFGQAIVHFVLKGFPESVREHRKIILWVHAIFYTTVILSMIIAARFPDFTALFVSPFSLMEFEWMYSKGDHSTGLRASDDNWQMFAHYIYNNITVAFQTFASGLIFCIGALFYVVFNSIYFGIIAEHLTSAGLGNNFWPFVIGHSAFEITAILIAGSAGIQLGLAILIPKNHTRAESLYLAAKSISPLLFGVLLFLIIAAFIEAYWSSMHETLGIRYIAGALLWLSVLCYFCFMGRAHED